MTDFRIERDSMGEVRLPAAAYYGAQTQRAVENFPISGQRLPPELIHALGLVKWAAAGANRDLGRFAEGQRPLDARQVEALVAACREVAEGRLDDQFPIDVFQTGSGTSSNMNANEVIANRAIELSGGDRFQADKPIHPNDHVNMGQSTNDMFPTAIHVAAAVAIQRQLIPALAAMPRGADAKGRRSGRTCSRSAAPIWPTPRRWPWARRSAGWPGKWSCRSIGPGGRAARPRTSRRRHGRRQRHQHPSRVRPPGRRDARPRDRHPAGRGGRTISRPTPSATAWSSATANCGPSP